MTSGIPLDRIDWTGIETTEHPGATGTSRWRTIQLPGMRIRMVEYSKDFSADHWCEKGHVIHCLTGELVCELEGAESVTLRAGESFVAFDGASSHKAVSAGGATAFIVDGDFLA
jgi:hypothetical protein